jgi:predicted metal-dependent phosphoesterase TrpH
MRADMHVHTRYSADAVLSPEALLRAARRKGLDAVAVTDHDTTKGWRECLAVSRRMGVPVILGEEVKVLEGGRKAGEVLAYFLSEEVKPGPLPEVLDDVRAQGGIACMAHPFDRIRQGFDSSDEHVDRFDAVEVLNARTLFSSESSRALDLARRHGKAMLGGSDCHTFAEVGNAFTVADASTPEELRKAILKRKTRAMGRRTFLMWHSASTLAKTRSIKRKLLRRRK